MNNYFCKEEVNLLKWNIPYVYFLMKKIDLNIVPELVVTTH